MSEKYRPLVDGLTIKESNIYGLGLFATEDLHAGIYLGVTHIYQEKRGWIRTPLGGFINHSEDPNCFINENIHYHDGTQRELYVVKPIRKGEEITIYYTLYKV